MAEAVTATTIDVGASGTLARRYAGALYDLAHEQRSLDATVDEVEALGRLIDGSEPLRRLLASPLLRAGEARGGLDAALADQGFSTLLRHFVGVVAINRRLRVLREIVRAFARLASERRGIVTADITTAHGLGDVQRAQLQARLAASGFGQVRLHEQVDPAILGGLIIRIGARLYDASIRSRLQRLAHRMKDAA